MTRKLLAPLLALILLMPTAACGLTGTAVALVSAATSPAPLGDRLTMDERGLYAMEAIYNVPASAYRTAVQRGLMTPAIRSTVRPILLQMRGIRNAARSAYRIGDATSWNARVAELRNLRDQVTALIPHRN